MAPRDISKKELQLQLQRKRRECDMLREENRRLMRSIRESADTYSRHLEILRLRHREAARVITENNKVYMAKMQKAEEKVADLRAEVKRAEAIADQWKLEAQRLLKELESLRLGRDDAARSSTPATTATPPSAPTPRTSPTPSKAPTPPKAPKTPPMSANRPAPANRKRARSPSPQHSAPIQNALFNVTVDTMISHMKQVSVNSIWKTMEPGYKVSNPTLKNFLDGKKVLPEMVKNIRRWYSRWRRGEVVANTLISEDMLATMRETKKELKDRGEHMTDPLMEELIAELNARVVEPIPHGRIRNSYYHLDV